MHLAFLAFVPAFLLAPGLRMKSSPFSQPIYAAMTEEPALIEVCCGKYCSKKGSKKTLELLEGLAAGRSDVCVIKADMSHTEHGCFDECTMGPNVRLGGQPKQDGGRIYNGIKGEESCAELLEKAVTPS